MFLLDIIVPGGEKPPHNKDKEKLDKKWSKNYKRYRKYHLREIK